MSALTSFLVSLPTTVKALSALGGAVVFGVAITLAGLRVQGLPAQVAANTAQIKANTTTIDRLARNDSLILARLDRTNCLLTLPDDVRVRLAANPLLLQRECP